MGRARAGEPEGGTVDDGADSQLFPGEELFGLETTNTKLKREATSVGDSTAYSTKGPVKA